MRNSLKQRDQSPTPNLAPSAMQSKFKAEPVVQMSSMGISSRPPEMRGAFRSTKVSTTGNPQIKIVYLRKDKKGNFVFKVLPQDVEITRSINDIYSLRQSLVFEFPFYYVGSADPASERQGQQSELCEHLFSPAFEAEHCF